jgi:GTP-binding protein EngB required for normal cell division
MNEVKVVIALGSTGNGKSTIGNRLTGKNEFKESEDANSETKQTRDCIGFFNDLPIQFVDTPGLNDSDGMDSEHVVQMVTFFKTLPAINSTIIVCNAQNPRISEILKNMIKLFCQIFRSSDFGNHVACVYTHSFKITPAQIAERKKECSESLQSIISATGIKANNQIPVFFVDSKTNNTENEFESLKNWIKSQPTLNTSLLRQVDPVYENIDTEQQEVLVSTTTEPIIESVTKTYTVKVPKKKWDHGQVGRILGIKKKVMRDETRTTVDQVQTGEKVIQSFEKQERNKKTTYGGRVVYDPWITISSRITETRK